MNETNESLILSGLYRTLALSIISHPSNLNVEANQQANFIAISPRAHEDDKPKLIGSGGETFHAMKVLLGLAASRLNVRFHLARVKGDSNTERADLPLVKPRLRSDWPMAELHALAVKVCGALFEHPADVQWNHQNPDKSVLEICLDPNESPDIPVVVVEDKLNCVFVAIGNAQGHHIRVALTRPLIKSDEAKGHSNLRRADAVHG